MQTETDEFIALMRWRTAYAPRRKWRASVEVRNAAAALMKRRLAEISDTQSGDQSVRQQPYALDVPEQTAPTQVKEGYAGMNLTLPKLSTRGPLRSRPQKFKSLDLMLVVFGISSIFGMSPPLNVMPAVFMIYGYDVTSLPES